MMSKYKNDDIYVARDRVQHICGQKYKNHVTGTRNTRMSHLAVLNPIMSHIYLKTWISGPQENIHCSISGVLQPLADWAERPPP